MEPDLLATAPGIPWEERDRGPAHTAFLATIRGALREPGRFFAALPPAGGYGPPLLFVMILGTLGAVSLVAWEAIALRAGLESEGLARLAGRTGGLGWALWFTLLLAPLILAAQLVLVTAVTHAALSLLGGAREGYRATFRACSYAQAPEIFLLVPVCGVLIVPLWSLGLRIFGLAVVHRVGIGRAAAAVLLPVFLCGGLLLAGLASLGLLAGLGGLALPD